MEKEGIDGLILKEKKNLDALEAISSIYENVALLGDIARRLPHILVQLWKQTDQKEIIIWAIRKTEVKIPKSIIKEIFS